MCDILYSIQSDIMIGVVLIKITNEPVFLNNSLAKTGFVEGGKIITKSLIVG